MLRLRGRAAGAGVTLAASPTFAQNAWAGVLLPARRPQAIVAKLNAVIDEGLTSPEAKTNLLKFSAITQPGTPEQFVKFIAEQSSIWAELVKMSGATIEN
jgi:tripartite-type tricarboxylate transporter receptor subunit TctC